MVTERNINRILKLLYGFKKIMIILYSCFFVMSMVFLNVSCVKKEKPKKQLPSSIDREKLTLFFKEVLSDENNFCTLIGDKPVSIECLVYYGEEEFKRLNQYILDHPELDVIEVDRYLEETWKYWEEVSHNFDIVNYVFAEVCPFPASKKVSIMIFINVKNTALILQKYYEDFRRVVGYDFHPLQVILDLKEGKKDFGYDAKGDVYVDMLEAGIIDPKKVTRVALENAASVAGMILTTECALVAQSDLSADLPPMGSMPGMGGMGGMM
jgi:hypothetical protein